MSTSIFAKPSVKGVSGKEKQTIQKPPLPTTNEVRIHTYKKREADQKLLSSFAHLQVEYSTLSAINDINDLIKKSRKNRRMLSADPKYLHIMQNWEAQRTAIRSMLRRDKEG